ncbi:MAG: bifunctional diguanylate cyclase/phosphodiesterase [Leptospirales bacterium]
MKISFRTNPGVPLAISFAVFGAAFVMLSLYLNFWIRQVHIRQEQESFSRACYDLQSARRMVFSINIEMSRRMAGSLGIRSNDQIEGFLAQGKAVVHDLVGREHLYSPSERKSVDHIANRYNSLLVILHGSIPGKKPFLSPPFYIHYLNLESAIDKAMIFLANRIQSDNSILGRMRVRTASEQRISGFFSGVLLLGEFLLFGLLFFVYKRAGEIRMEKTVRTLETFRSENKVLDLLVEHLPDLILLKSGEEGRWEILNPEGKRFLGMDDESSWKGRTDSEVRERFPQLRNVLDDSMEMDRTAWIKGVPLDSKEEMVHSLTGKTHSFSMTRFPLFRPDGQKDHLLVIGRDITEILEEKEGILRQGEWYQTLFLMVGEPLFLSCLTHDGVLGAILEVNPAASAVYGYSSREFHRMTMLDLLSPTEHEDCLREIFPRLLADGHHDFESVHRSREGREILVDLSARILERDGNRFLLTLVHDKTLKEREKVIERMLANADRQILQGESLPFVLDGLCNTLVDFFPFMYLGILKKEPEGATRLVAGDVKGKTRYEHGTPARWDDSPGGQGVSGNAMREGKTQMMATGDPRYPAVFKEELERVGIRFMWAVPLRQKNGEVVGTITSGSRYPFGPAPEEVLILEKYSDRIGLLFDLAEDQKEIRFGYEALQSVSDAICMLDLDGMIRWVNQAFLSLAGYSREECIGRDYQILRSGWQDLELYEKSWKTIRSGEVFECEIVNQRKDGSQYVAWQTISPLVGEDGTVVRFICVQRDITQRKENELRIWRMANYDPLTGLANRNLLRERIAQDISRARRNREKVNLLFLDLDYFKAVNDSFGHEVGDTLLKQVSEKLLFAARESDTVARLGGDEFVFVQPAVQCREDAMALNRRIQELFIEPFYVNGQTIQVGVSVGIVTCPEDGEDLDALLRKSDIALYQAKNRGRGRGEFFQAVQDDFSAERNQLIDSLGRALTDGEFVLFYQPVILISDGRMTGVESLIRWKRQGFDLFLPSQFIFLLEETEMIHPLGEWVIREVCRQASVWAEEGIGQGFRIAVNISPVQLSHAGFVGMVSRILEEAGVTAEGIGLEFEITESRAMQSETALEALVELRRMGVRISIDDFGTGYSSISLLRGFPVDTLKIDQSFIRDIGHDPNARSIINAIVTMAKSLGLSLVAEGVESEEERLFLQEIGCDFFQGYLWSRPLPPEEIVPFFRS